MADRRVTALGIVALLPLPLEAALVLLPVIGIALNGTSSVLYGSVPDLVAPEKRTRAFGIFYTGTIGSGAVSPALYGLVGDALGVPVDADGGGRRGAADAAAHAGVAAGAGASGRAGNQDLSAAVVSLSCPPDRPHAVNRSRSSPPAPTVR